MNIKDEIPKINIYKWIILFVFISFSISLFFIIWIYLRIHNLEDSQNYIEILSIYISLLVYFLTIFAGSIIFSINYSFKERHRREQSREWELSGKRLEGIEKALKILEDQYSKSLKEEKEQIFFFSSINRNEISEQIDYFIKLRNQTLKNFGTKKNSNKNFKFFKKCKNRYLSISNITLNKLNKIKDSKKSNAKIIKIEKEKKWVLMPINESIIISKYLIKLKYGIETFRETYLSKNNSESRGIMFVNPSLNKIRFYVKRSLIYKDNIITNNYNEISLQKREKPILYEIELENKIKLIYNKNNQLTCDILDSRFEFEFNYEGNLSFKDKKNITEDLREKKKKFEKFINQLSKSPIDYDEEFIINNIIENDEIIRINFILGNFLNQDKIKENWEKLKHKIYFQTIEKEPQYLYSDDKNYFDLTSEQKMFLHLLGKNNFGLLGIFPPQDFIDNWKIYPEKTYEEIQIEIEKFKNKYPNADIKKDFFRRFETLYISEYISTSVIKTLYINKLECSFFEFEKKD